MTRRFPYPRLLLVLTALLPRPAAAQPPATAWWEFGMNDPVLDEVVLFQLGQTWTQAADIGEVLETVHRVDTTDPESWAREWQKTADRLFAVGEASEADGHPFSASHAYLRAATYYRATLMRHMHPQSDEVTALTRREAEAFRRSLALGDSACKPVEIPYEQTTLPGFFCRAAHSDGPAPVIIFNVGRDVWAEDAKIVADEANKRGYHALLFDGPGQGKTLRLQGLPFRPDWEHVITPVVDFALAQRCVDARRVALWGESMGGYLVPRAAAFEHRLALIITNPGVLDWSRVFRENLTELFPDALDLLGQDEAAFNAKIYEIMAQSALGRWGLEDSMWKHGVSTPAQLVHELERYSLGGREAQITAHALVVDAEEENRGQARELYDALQTRKHYLLFTARETAQFHDQPGARAISTQRIFDWIDDAL